MAKPKKDADRRAVIEQMKREQQRKDRRRTVLIIGSAVLVGVLIIGVAVAQYLSATEKESRDLAAIGLSASEASCGEVITKKGEGNNDHRAEGAPIDYEDAPPAAGPHWGRFLIGNEIRKFWTVDDRPPVERLVHSLEHGHTILWYDESLTEDDDAMADIRAIAKKFPGNADPEDKFMAAPWTEEDGEAFPDGAKVALTHWSVGGTNGNPEGQLGIWQYCDGVSGEVVEEFMADYPWSDSPEPNAA